MQTFTCRWIAPPLVLASLLSCSSMPTKHFTSDNKWFTLDYPANWQVDFEDSIYTFTNTQDSDWAFQVSAYRLDDDILADFNIHTALKHEKLSHPSATIVTLGNRKAVYYTAKDDSFLVRYWVVGDRRCKALYTFTTNSDGQGGNLHQVETSISSMKLQ